jgi:endonuclease/exonuclease/phosphatase family metal-dependent hydrolase
VLRVLTLNIWNLSGRWRSRREAILRVVRRCGPDVVCLQEVVANERGNQAEWLASELGDWSIAYAGEPLVAATARFGNAVLSRWPIETHSSAQLPYVPDELEVQRVVVHARTGGVDVFSTHLAWQLHDAALRERQVQALVRFVSARTDPAAPLGPVVAGDFNAEPDSSAVRYLSGLASLDGTSVYLQDAWRLAGDGGPGITWSNRNPHAALDREPDRRIDYIFSGFHGRAGGGRPVECRVVADEPADGIWPSDHFGLLAVLQR